MVQEDGTGTGTGGFVVVVAAATVVSVEDVLAGLVRIGSFVVANDNLSCSSSAAFAAAVAASTIAATATVAFNVNNRIPTVMRKNEIPVG